MTATNAKAWTDAPSCGNDAHARCLDEVAAASSECEQRVSADALTSTNDKPSGYVIRRSEANDHHHPPRVGA